MSIPRLGRLDTRYDPPSTHVPPMKKLNLLTPLGQIGYGFPGRYILRELTAASVRVALFPIGNVEFFTNDEQDPVRIGLANAGTYDAMAPSVRICIPQVQAEHVGRGKHAGFPFFELDRFDAYEVHHLSQLDVILVASRWAAGVIEAHGIKVPTAVVPLGVDRLIFHEEIEKEGPVNNLGPTVFVNIGKWERRKGHDFLLEAFCKAFTPRDNVMLKLLCHNYTFPQEANDAWARLFLQSAMGAKVQLIPRQPNQHAVAEIIARCDCGVFPSRAEGFNLGLLECMSVGLHVIATTYSAHSEFATESNCRLVSVSETEPAYDGQWLKGQGRWAKLGDSQLEQLVYHLREIHRLKQEGSLTRNDPGIDTAKMLTWRHTAESVLHAVE